MGIPRWNPVVDVSKQEAALLKHLGRVRKLLPFLRRQRHVLFDDAFQLELEAMYRQSGAGKSAVAPALMAMATLVQEYLGVSDAEMVKLTVLDLSVQCVLDRVGATEPAFSQGALHDFRLRLIRHDMDRRLLERTVELATNTREFDSKKVPRSLRVAVDSAPLEGAGRVEDTLNLLAHAGRDLARRAAKASKISVEEVCRQSGAEMLLQSSIKKALDLQWTRRGARDEGLRKLINQLDQLAKWVVDCLPRQAQQPPLSETLATLKQLREQDLEPDPNDPHGGLRIRRGVAKDRRISVTDKEMRHGRKNKNKTINGYKRHIAVDLDSDVILAGAILPANQQEAVAARPLKNELASQGIKIAELYIDRGYLSSPAVRDVRAEGGAVFCRPWVIAREGVFSKLDFHFDLRSHQVTCPAGISIPFRAGERHTLHFPRQLCNVCPIRSLCTRTSVGARSLTLHEDELLHEELRRALRSRSGRAKLRRRTRVEHRLAHLVDKTGDRARFRGVRKNTFALRRTAAILNLETMSGRQPRGRRSLPNRSAS